MMMRKHRTAEEQREGSCRARELKKDRGEEGRKLRLRTFIPQTWCKDPTINIAWESTYKVLASRR